MKVDVARAEAVAAVRRHRCAVGEDALAETVELERARLLGLALVGVVAAGVEVGEGFHDDEGD